MIGLVVATHARLADELVAAAGMIIGPSERVRAICIEADSSVDELRRQMGQAIEQVDTDGDGVIIMTDMFGGTPSNISLAYLDPDRIEIVAGVNLPMVLKFFNSQEQLGVAELAALLKAYGQQSVTLASEYLKH